MRRVIAFIALFISGCLLAIWIGTEGANSYYRSVGILDPIDDSGFLSGGLIFAAIGFVIFPNRLRELNLALGVLLIGMGPGLLFIRAISTTNRSSSFNQLVNASSIGPGFLLMVGCVLLFFYSRGRKTFLKESWINSIGDKSLALNQPPAKAAEAIISQPPSTSTDVELRKAKQLLDDGVIDEEEYKAMKKKIIDRG